MEFNPEDKDLVEIIESVGEIALSSGRKKKEAKVYVDTMVRAYISNYIDVNGAMPNRSFFGEAINRYVTEKFQDGPLCLSKMVKGMMRDLIFGSYDKYRRAHYKPKAFI